jgi:hypothetical protein
MILRLEDILGTNDDTFQTIWYGTVMFSHTTQCMHSTHHTLSDRYAATSSLSYVSNGKRMTKRSVLILNFNFASKYLHTLERPLTLHMQSSLLSGIARIYHRQCQLHYGKHYSSLIMHHSSLGLNFMPSRRQEYLDEHQKRPYFQQ